MAPKVSNKPLSKPTRSASGTSTSAQASGYGGFQTPTTGTNRPPVWLGGQAGGGATPNAGGSAIPKPPIQKPPQIPPWLAAALGAAGNTQLPTAVGAAGTPHLPTAFGAAGSTHLPAAAPYLPAAFGAAGNRYLPTAVGAAGTPHLPTAFGAAGPRWLQPNNNRPSETPNTGPVHVAGNVRTVDGQAPVVEGYTQPETPAPIQLGSGDVNNSMSDTLRPIYELLSQQSNEGGGGFGSTYGGNWRRGRGGGGGGGWGGGGYSDTPAWLNQYLNLNSWNI